MRQAERRTLAALSAALAAAAILAATPTPSEARDYDSRRSGHPLRIVAYALHPVGVILDTLIFRPAWWLAGHEPLRTLVGRERPIPRESETEPEPAEP